MNANNAMTCACVSSGAPPACRSVGRVSNRLKPPAHPTEANEANEVSISDAEPSFMFAGLIRALARKTQNQVVVLIDRAGTNHTKPGAVKTMPLPIPFCVLCALSRPFPKFFQPQKNTMPTKALFPRFNGSTVRRSMFEVHSLIPCFPLSACNP
jgi:hypothetical protein